MVRSRIIRTVFVLGLAGVLAGSAGVVAAQGAIRSATEPVVPYCPEAMVLTARGSGSEFSGPRNYPGAAGPSTGWEGEGIARLLERADLHGFTVRALDPEEYPAVEAWRLDEIMGSIERGRRSAVRRVADMQAAGCQPVVIPVGYSQGAMALNGAEWALAAGAYLPGVLYLGNPLRDGSVPRNTGSAPPVPGRAFLPEWPWGVAPALNAPGQTGIDYCYRNDVFCDPGGTSVDIHTSYFTGIPGERNRDREVAEALSGWTSAARGRIDRGGRVPVTRPVDEILVLDTTDPGVTGALARDASRIMGAVTGVNPVSRVGVAVLREGEARWLLPPTGDPAALAAALVDPGGMSVGDVLPAPESGERSVFNRITVTDTEVGTDQGSAGHAGGRDVVAAVLSAIDAQLLAPNAVLDVPAVWFTDQPAGATGMLSRVFVDGPVRQRLDFGDGTVVDPAVDGYVEHVWRRPGTYRVTLTVTDSLGRTGVDRRRVRVYSGDVAAELDGALRGLSAWSGSA
ncbi:PKD domain-containing protein [Corynebacterium pygosceleis]|uniref:PKD domain-containing protein n=1 Tax=Corynebacterium pygosceleis TaxID=2800406 RepID=A0A9Q4C7F3_9CORY|nr:PKD domain-containing protein [Corynebacterium pygosceleis]MCK7637579.1 PKD domain-containing protein [Corynebacterium pygosceleis]MCK7674770.1 PKD domain-containing protein [Corynebacterium pygosceleis]MCL0119641.1 PKD domain-containing protein [Corynebacterium pygosceleis]MCX7468092.1 PKD domain-containing protein [Corynebacterium pygosceleis]